LFAKKGVPDARTVTVAVNADADLVYDFARRPENLPRWAAGLASGVQQVGGAWYADSPMGRVRIAMSAENPYRVLDHDVTLPDGRTVTNAFRVTPVGNGCLLIFVVVRDAAATADAFEADVAAVERDLQALSGLVETMFARAART
jgi:uncharacterized protein (DUF736 family)